jgi:type I restriction enzyme S subunit
MESNHQLPKDWRWVKVGEYVNSVKGKKPKRISKEKSNECSIPYVNIKAFEKNIIDEYTDGVGCVLCDNGDFLMVWDGSRSGFVGKGIKGALGSTLVKLDFPNIENNYVYYFLQSKFLDINTRAKGVGIPHVDPNILWNYDLLIPPKPTQQAIVSKIEEIFSDLDKGIEQLKTAQQQLKTYRQSVLKWAFEGKLTEENVKEGELPKGWYWVKIGDICKVVRGGSPRPAGDPKYYDGNIPFLKVADLTKDDGIYLTTFKYTIKEPGLHKTRRISPNTLLLSNSGATLGVPKICMIDATMNDGVAAFLELDARSNHYLYYFWLSKTRELRNINMGAAQPNLNTDIIRDYDVPYCSFGDQDNIVQEIESRLSVADKMEESITQSLQQSEALRQSILKRAFEGRLVK